MNTFDAINLVNTDDDEIKDDKGLRNKKKKLRQHQEKLSSLSEEDPRFKELSDKIKITEILIQEYEHLKNLDENVEIQREKKKEIEKKNAKKNRNKKNKKKKKEKELLERESQKNQEYWAKYEKEQKRKEEQARKLEEERRKKERERKEREERERVEREWEERRRQEEWEQWKRENAKRKQEKGHQRREYQKREYQTNLTKKLSPKDKLFKDCEIEDIPEDLSQLYNSFDKKKYRELTLKYHPDKSDYHVGYIKALNKIKDKHQPVTVKHDETWVK